MRCRVPRQSNRTNPVSATRASSPPVAKQSHCGGNPWTSKGIPLVDTIAVQLEALPNEPNSSVPNEPKSPVRQKPDSAASILDMIALISYYREWIRFDEKPESRFT
jgi:hypothetical protein